MISQLYQDHLQSQLNPAEYPFVRCIIQLLQSIKTLSLEKLANALPLPVLFDTVIRLLNVCIVAYVVTPSDQRH